MSYAVVHRSLAQVDVRAHDATGITSKYQQLVDELKGGSTSNSQTDGDKFQAFLLRPCGAEFDIFCGKNDGALEFYGRQKRAYCVGMLTGGT